MQDPADRRTTAPESANQPVIPAAAAGHGRRIGQQEFESHSGVVLKVPVLGKIQRDPFQDAVRIQLFGQFPQVEQRGLHAPIEAKPRGPFQQPGHIRTLQCEQVLQRGPLLRTWAAGLDKPGQGVFAFAVHCPPQLPGIGRLRVKGVQQSAIVVRVADHNPEIRQVACVEAGCHACQDFGVGHGVGGPHQFNSGLPKLLLILQPRGFFVPKYAAGIAKPKGAFHPGQARAHQAGHGGGHVGP